MSQSDLWFAGTADRAYSLIPSHCLVPVCVAAEQRVLFSAAAFIVSSDRGELLPSDVLQIFGCKQIDLRVLT